MQTPSTAAAPALPSHHVTPVAGPSESETLDSFGALSVECAGVRSTRYTAFLWMNACVDKRRVVCVPRVPSVKSQLL